MPILLKSLVATVFLMVGSLSWADCACLCADGKQITMCNTVEEAQANPNACVVGETNVCPTPTGEASTTAYDAPAEDATNCRDMSVWDNNAFSVIKACDVLPAT